MNTYLYMYALNEIATKMWKEQKKTRVEIFLWTWKRFIGFSEMNLYLSFISQIKQKKCSDKEISRDTFIYMYKMNAKFSKVLFQWSEWKKANENKQTNKQTEKKTKETNEHEENVLYTDRDRVREKGRETITLRTHTHFSKIQSNAMQK